MQLTVIGCAGSFPGPASPASSYLVQADDDDGRTWRVLLDIGNGSLGVLQRHIDPRQLDAIFLSHLHPDHCLDICGLYVMQKYRPAAEGAVAPKIPVWGPGEAPTRLAMAYAGIEDGHGMSTVFDFTALMDRAAVRAGPFTVTPHRVNHPVETYGLRVEAGGSVLAYTGDTDSCAALSPLMTGADLVLADSAFVEGRDSRRGVHMTGRRCAEAAETAGGVGQLVLTHMPAWNDPQVCLAEANDVLPGVVQTAVPEGVYRL